MDHPRPRPRYTAPKQFSIGTQLTPEPLVKISQIKAHLVLLHAFAELKNEVEGLQELEEGTILGPQLEMSADHERSWASPQMPVDLERKWPWFVGLAVQRSVLICCDPGYFHIYIFFFVVDLTFGAAHWHWGMRSTFGRRFFHRSMFWW